MPRMRILTNGLRVLVLAGSFTGICSWAATATGVQILQFTNRLRVDIDGQLFTEFYFKDVPRPFCYPLIGPDGVAMTRDWPMKNSPNEDHDHPHHRSLWFAHGAVNGHDFWSEAKDFGKIIVDTFETKSGKDFGLVHSRDKWVAADGAIVCTDDQILRVYRPPNPSERVFDFEITLHALDKPLTFGDTKEGTMAIRLAETMKLKRGQGRIVNSAGDLGTNTWGRRADWCDYSGPVEGKTVGVAIFDHPQNPHHPTWWQVRDYGLFAANPFGRHDFEKLADKSAGDLTVPAGQSVTFRYRFYLHRGDEREAKVAAQYAAYVKETSAKP